MKPRVNGDTRNKKGQIPGNLWRRKGHSLTTWWNRSKGHSLTTWWNISREEGKGLSGLIGRRKDFLLMKIFSRQSGGSVRNYPEYWIWGIIFV